PRKGRMPLNVAAAMVGKLKKDTSTSTSPTNARPQLLKAKEQNESEQSLKELREWRQKLKDMESKERSRRISALEVFGNLKTTDEFMNPSISTDSNSSSS